jgi:glycosyltransferase involved in cell wall biosynthesis
LKIVLVSLARRGGMVHFMAELANALVSLSPTAIVRSSSASGTYFSRELAQIRVPIGKTPLHALSQSMNPLTWHSLARHLRKVNGDLIHIVGVHPWNPGVAMLCKILQMPLVYTVHDPDAHPGAPLLIRAADWMTVRMADHVVVLTRHGRARLLSRGFSRKRISVIPHPMYSLFQRWKPRFAGSDRIILCFGRMEAYKGMETVVQAFLSIRGSLTGWKLIIAGSGRVPASIAGEVGNDIMLINRYVSDREVAHLMHSSAIVAAPYTSATQSGVIALAQAFGRPVIATAVGGLTEMVIEGKTGILIPPNNVSALATAMKLLARDRGRLSRLQRSTAACSESIWSPRGIAIAHLRMYAKLLGRRDG